jgi:hypothetical protein
MKEISLKKSAEKMHKGEMATSMPKESYPSFQVYENAPEELMSCAMGCEMTAKIKLTSKDKHEGPGARKSVGFDVMSVMIDDTNSKVDKARAKGKEIAETVIKKKE